MNIVLPKTLAEPWTIPWFVKLSTAELLEIVNRMKSDMERTELINRMLTESFNKINDQYAPNGNGGVKDGKLYLSTRGFITSLVSLAEFYGALEADGSCGKIRDHTGKQIGNWYTVTYRIPNNNELQSWWKTSGRDE